MPASNGVVSPRAEPKDEHFEDSREVVSESSPMKKLQIESVEAEDCPTKESEPVESPDTVAPNDAMEKCLEEDTDLTDGQKPEKKGTDNEDTAACPTTEEDLEDLRSEVDEDFNVDEPKIPFGTMKLNPLDASFNALCTDNSMFSMQTDGFNQLFSGMRASVGVKSGRYYFEVKLMDQPRQTRVGFSASSGYSNVIPDIDPESGLPENTVSNNLSTLCLDDTFSYAFDASGSVFRGGMKDKDANPKWSRTDIVGVLLNVEKKTLTLYLNGTKTPTGQVTQLPDSLFDDEGKLKMALYPTVVCKHSAIECNFSSKVWKDLPFKVRTVGDILAKDAVFSPKSSSSMDFTDDEEAENTVKVMIPCGFETANLITDYVGKEKDAIVLTQESLNKWAEKSGNYKRGNYSKYNIQCVDVPNSVFPVLLRGNRKYVYSFSGYNNMHPKGRRECLAKLNHGLNVEVIAVVGSMEEFAAGKKMAPLLMREKFEELTLPTVEEGFSKVLFTDEIAEELLQAWKKDCKLKSKIAPQDLKKSSFFQDRATEFARIKALRHKGSGPKLQAAKEKEREAKREEKRKVREEEKKKREEEEGKLDDCDDPAAKMEESLSDDEEEEPNMGVLEEFAEEDWMLAGLRNELFALLHAFRLDVDDPERPSFPAVHFPYYFQLYTGKSLNVMLNQFSVKSFDELARLVPDLFKHTIGVDEFQLRKSSDSLLQEYDLILLGDAMDDVNTATPAHFIELTEQARQERQDRLDAGDENAALTFAYKPTASPGRIPNFAGQGSMERQGSRGGYEGLKRHRGNSGQPTNTQTFRR